MQRTSNIDTIVAIATPIGSGAIGILRLSGEQAWPIIHPLFHPGKIFKTRNRTGKKEQPHSHFLRHGFIIEPETEFVIDEVLVAYMKAPHSYTREDVVEIQSHSGPAVLRKLLNLVLARGCRLAEPGEFTRRAFLNGRIDLSQAESIADLINARTDAAMHAAALQLSGEMKSQVSEWTECIQDILVNVEAAIEFEEETHIGMDKEEIKQRLEKNIIMPIKRLIQQYESGHVLRDGIRLDIVGRPNVGKSSLLNKLVKSDKAIVTPIPGTTRDLIEVFSSIKGIPVFFTDTAGLHSTDDPIEAIGIQKTRQNILQSNFVLIVVDASEPFTEDDLDILNSLSDKQAILVINKIDLVKNRVHIPEELNHLEKIRISALTGEGLDRLEEKIGDICLGNTVIQPGKSIIPSLRQKILLEQALGSIENAVYGFEQQFSEEVFAYDLKNVLTSLKMVSGEKQNDEMILDEVFNRFCIGK